jgi:hypothetical protein
MKYIGLISSDARGASGGNVASRNRFGTYLRAHVSPVQPRTTSQVANRNAFGAISSAWRGLTAGEVQGWNTLATTVTFKDTLGNSYSPTGAQLFMLMSRNLIRNGGSTNANAPTAIPAIPALLTLTPTITVTAGAVSAISLAFTPTPVPAGVAMFVYASKAVSAGVTFVSPSQYRFVTAEAAATASPIALLTPYTALFGTPPITGRINFRARYIDTASGYSGPLIQGTAVI